jgi:hypothetical protein
MKDFKIGDLVTINYDCDTFEANYGIIIRIDKSEEGTAIYRVAHPQFEAVYPYDYYELKETKNEYKPAKFIPIQDGFRDNQKENGKEGSEAGRKDRGQGHE